jgi:hypothetical protein
MENHAVKTPKNSEIYTRVALNILQAIYTVVLIFVALSDKFPW